jgi:predicted alpha/beta-fold hydrolase
VGTRGLDTNLTAQGQPWHPGFIEDALSTVEYLISLYAKDPTKQSSSHLKLLFVGFSAGANIVQKTLLHYSRLDLVEKKHIVGGMIVCVGSDYKTIRQRLESSLFGKIYSFLLCMVAKEILAKNSAALNEKLREDYELKQMSKEDEKIDETSSMKTISSVLSSPNPIRVSRELAKVHLLSQYDEIVGRRIHRYRSVDDLADAMSMNHFSKMKVPVLALQPRDDPLHSVRMKEISINIKFVFIHFFVSVSFIREI